MKYNIEIIETLQYEEEVEAESLEEALRIIEEKYKKEEIILSAENYVDTCIREAKDQEYHEELDMKL